MFQKIVQVQNVENCTTLKCRIPTTAKMELFKTKKNFKYHDPTKNLENKKIDAIVWDQTGPLDHIIP